MALPLPLHLPLPLPLPLHLLLALSMAAAAQQMMALLPCGNTAQTNRKQTHSSAHFGVVSALQAGGSPCPPAWMWGGARHRQRGQQNMHCQQHKRVQHLHYRLQKWSRQLACAHCLSLFRLWLQL